MGLALPLTEYVWLFYQILWRPFAPFLSFPPLVAIDKPFYIMRPGAIFAAVVWAAVIYLISSVRLSFNPRGAHK